MSRRRYVDAGTINPYNRSTSSRTGRYMFCKIDTQPHILRNASAIAALPTASQGQTDYVQFGNGTYAEYFQTTAQTLLPLLDTTKGLEITGDQVDNEAVEIVIGSNTSRSPVAFTVGTDRFLFRAKFLIDDADGSDQFLLGFRKQEAFAVPASFLTTGDGIYTDFAGIGFAATVADPNVVRTATDLNNGGSTTVTSTGFTWADGKVHQLEVRVDIAGRAFYYINGVPVQGGNTVTLDGDGAALTSQTLSQQASFTFDSTDVLVPFIFARQDAALTPIYLREFEVGLWEDILL